eukprot:1544275-Prymnesium_polylepis.1
MYSRAIKRRIHYTAERGRVAGPKKRRGTKPTRGGADMWESGGASRAAGYEVLVEAKSDSELWVAHQAELSGISSA